MAYGAILGQSQNKNTVILDNSSLTTLGGTALDNNIVLDVDNSSPSTQTTRNIYAGTADLTAGSSTLATGLIYLVYE